jgi:glutathione-specific gamma-glutamylcyclotransferase
LAPKRSDEASDAVWIFGYGSLVWRADFEYAEARPALLAGWARRFWQGSTDHRGIPGAPGRVVTLVRSPGAHCFGRAYRLEPHLLESVLEQLDHRERGGYVRMRVRLRFPESGDSTAAGFVYRATPRNPNYLGPAPLAEIARQARAAAGPSGPNIEYVRELARFLREHGAEDEHVFALERLLAT